MDGKELRGSIQAGQTRGEVCVSALAHQNQQVVAQTFYNGSKESDRPAVSHLLEHASLWGQKVTLDALHLRPLTLQSIHTANGVYVVGLKANQAHLYRYCICRSLFNNPDYEQVDITTKRHSTAVWAFIPAFYKVKSICDFASLRGALTALMSLFRFHHLTQQRRTDDDC
ncbi:hypothetical protein [Runella slithyformis]|uniref:hypothetical protein n=1 Tax=Runella slithyformis TaxID=106 RepID=UPI00146C27B7|nr:hypothetical protein [Runella slithyformis]